MKSFPSQFTTQKNTTAGAKPVWILQLAVDSGSVFISDRVTTIIDTAGNAQTTKSWVSGWGTIQDGVTGGLAEYSISELSIDLLTDANDAENIIHLIDNHDLETNLSYLCCWFEGITDRAQIFFAGYVKDIIPGKNDYGCTISLQDPALKIDSMVGIVATKDLLGNALHNDDVGKILPIIFNGAAKVPAIRARSPIRTTLKSAVAASTFNTEIFVSDMTGIAVGKYLQLDSEFVFITEIIDTQINVNRGQYGTTPAAHDLGTTISLYSFDAAEAYVCIAAGHEVGSIDKIWARINGAFHDVTALAFTYPANGWPGQNWATIRLPQSVTIQQLTSLNMTGVISALDNSHSHGVDATTANTSQSIPSSVSGHVDIVIPYGTFTFVEAIQVSASFPAAPGTITAMSLTYTAGVQLLGAHSWCVTLGSIVVDGWFSDSPSSVTRTITISDATAMNQNTLRIWYRALGNGTPVTVYTGTATITSATRTITYATSATSVSSSGSNITLENTLNLTGTQIAATIYEDGIYCDFNSSSLLPTDPPGACSWLIQQFGVGVSSTVGYVNENGLPGSWPVAQFGVCGAIIDQKKLSYWLNKIAFERFCIFRFKSGQPTLFNRLQTVSRKTVAIGMIRNFSRRLSAVEDIINKIELRYNRDYSNTTGEPYQSLLNYSDATSQGKHGIREQPDLFKLELVNPNDYAALYFAQYYIDYFKTRHWIYQVEVFLDNLELEYSDRITIGVPNNLIGVVRKAGITPGDEDELDTIKFDVWV